MAITNSNGFRGMATLQRIARDSRIAEIEGGGMDEGRVFLHAAAGWRFRDYGTVSKSVGSVRELRDAMRWLGRDV